MLIDLSSNFRFTINLIEVYYLKMWLEVTQSGVFSYAYWQVLYETFFKFISLKQTALKDKMAGFNASFASAGADSLPLSPLGSPPG